MTITFCITALAASWLFSEIEYLGATSYNLMTYLVHYCLGLGDIVMYTIQQKQILLLSMQIYLNLQYINYYYTWLF